MKNPNLEAVKEVGRWALLLGISWVITQILTQISVVPETYNLKVWEFSFVIPVRAGIILALTFAGRYIDKYKHEDKTKSTGIIPF